MIKIEINGQSISDMINNAKETVSDSIESAKVAYRASKQEAAKRSFQSHITKQVLNDPEMQQFLLKKALQDMLEETEK